MCSAEVWGQVSGPETTPFQDLNQGLQRLRDEDLDALPASSMGEDITALLRHINGCQAEVMRRIVRFDDGVGYAGTGTFGTKSWLNWNCNLSYAAASHQVEVARQLTALPETTKAFADGDISYTHASMIARTAEKLGDKMESDAESILVTAAKELDPYRLRIACMKLRHCIDPDGVLEDANEATELRFLHLSQTLGGVFYLNGRLDPEGGATLQAALNAVSGPPAPDDRRTPKQRRADAAVELARRQLDQGDLPEVGGQRPHLSVIVEAATLAKQPGSPAAELEWAQTIPAETARRLACDAAITPIFRGAESNQPKAGPTTRSISGSQRKALVARDRGCRFRGCDRPPGWTDAHHIQHWADGGKHVMKNLVLLCRRHHRMVHEEGWSLVWNDQRELVAVPP
ncbi:MAG TPA: DUF222 domain-containing protein [Candidatus Dormibacteraeota bacterium]